MSEIYDICSKLCSIKNSGFFIGVNIKVPWMAQECTLEAIKT